MVEGNPGPLSKRRQAGYIRAHSEQSSSVLSRELSVPQSRIHNSLVSAGVYGSAASDPRQVKL